MVDIWKEVITEEGGGLPVGVMEKRACEVPGNKEQFATPHCMMHSHLVCFTCAVVGLCHYFVGGWGL